MNRSIARMFNEALDLGYYNVISKTKRFEVNDALLICGDPRGGTTWLAELIKLLPTTAMLWEPLAVAKVNQFKSVGFQWRQYIPEHESWPEAKTMFEDLFAGKMLSSYLCQSTTTRDLAKANQLLIKFCRANQLLPWLTKEFHFNRPPIYLVRHPCAVVASQLKQGGWSHVKPNFEIPNGRYNSFYSDHTDFLRAIDTIEMRLAATWCLCNQVPLSHSGNNKRWLTITYESLLLNIEEQLNRIEKRWGIKFPQSVYDKVGAASTTTVVGSPIREGRVSEQLSYWKNQLTSKQIDNILRVMDYFHVDLYNSEELPFISFKD